MSIEQLAEYAQPFAMSPVVEVDTARPVDVAALARQVVTNLRS
jgi:hypothetical protein